MSKNFDFRGRIALAPMAGVTDLPFRLICKKHGADLLYTEMINAKAVCFNDKNTHAMLRVHPQEHPVIVQIFGNEPVYMAKAAEILSSMGRFAAIDVNMGCPVPKVVKGGEGSALMKTPEIAAEIIRSMKSSTDLPVTVKFRKGWNESQVNAVDFALKMQEAGADAVAIHGRTREQYYSGKADWKIIAEVKSVLSIPVFANGDIFSAKDALEILQQTRADSLMIGRGAQGNPFIFRQILHYMKNNVLPKEISVTERIDTALEHYRLALSMKEEYKVIREMRKHLGWYLKGMQGSASLRNKINSLDAYEDVFHLMEEYRSSVMQEDILCV
ncbi:MAG: tRNA dihydrouridine synthase DusB [Peptostreptococcaceae bacterium]|nr:tRNA dihydrouridine synthase DusB [Peptostreptococcaceae bacterium]